MPGELTILGAITEKWTNYEPYYIHFFLTFRTCYSTCSTQYKSH